MKETIILILLFILIGFAIYKIIELVIFDRIMKEERENFDRILTEALEETRKELEKKKENKVVAKKTTTRKTKKSENKKEK